ncbi:MAG: enoyl-CoA hydratase/isomerase family protein [Alphaproteobacteria bacterium]|nr:enoyl-CoA hydratase/isomerase family protein [Alphaproteobacteria bacterium]
MLPLPSPTPHVQAFLDGSTGWLVFNRPARRNALNAEMWAAIPPLMKSLDECHDVKAVVIRGAGHDAFAAGADISEFGETRANAEAAKVYEALNGAALAAIRDARKPVIAMIQGFCIGGGLAIALACDIRVADASALFALPPGRLGLAYPLDGLRDLVVAIGAPAAKDLLFTARRVKAHEALRLDLINHVYADIEPETAMLCAEIADGAPLTMTHAKRAIDLITGRAGHVDSEAVAILAGACFDSEDYLEGRNAFAEKRKPTFNGR